MITKKTVWCIVLSSSTVIFGISNFNCDAERPLKGSDVACTCVTQNNIRWQLSDVTLSTCSTSGVCSPKPVGYSFQTDTSNLNREYSLIVQDFDYSSCAVYSCQDISTNAEEKVTLAIAAFNSTVPSDIVEPGANESGKIEVTTECLFKESDIVVKWYTVEGEEQKEYKPSTVYSIPSACTDTCNGETAVTLNIGFEHTEISNTVHRKSVKFRLEVYHNADESNKLMLETTDEYHIAAPYTEPPSTSATTATTTTSSSIISANESTPQMTSTVTSTVSSSPTSGDTTVIIVAATVGGLFVVGIVFIVVLFWNHKRKKQLGSTNRSHTGQIRLEPVFSGRHSDHRLKPHSQDYSEQHYNVKHAEQPYILNPRVEGDRFFGRNVSSYADSTGQQYNYFQHNHGREYRF